MKEFAAALAVDDPNDEFWCDCMTMIIIIQSSIKTNQSISSLRAEHEEAGSRLILHFIHAHMITIVIIVRDTDMFLLLLATYDSMGCTRPYMRAGTSKALTYFPVHEICKLLPVVKWAHYLPSMP